MALALGFMAPDDDEDRATKNFHRYSQRVVDKFVSELSFFYNPVEFHKLFSGSMFPALGLISDFLRFLKHFGMEVTGIDFEGTPSEKVRKAAQPVKNLMKMAPVTKAMVPYIASLSDNFAREYDVTIQEESSIR